MDKFEEVASDIIRAIDKLDYNDLEKNILCKNIMYNLYKMLESKEEYNRDIELLKKGNSLRISLHSDKEQ